MLPKSVRVVEVGPRDGLQNEKQALAVETKIALIEALADAGVSTIESGSFVNPKWVPQMANSDEVLAGLRRKSGINYAVLIPNMQGFTRAVEAQADELAVFTAASETFSQKNTNCSTAETLKRFEPVLEAAKSKGLPIRAYVSCALGCPYEGDIDPQKVLDLSRELLAMGCYEVSISDTIGIAGAGDCKRMLDVVCSELPVSKLAVHYHDTYGQALANILQSLQMGIATIDSSVAGLGGCPYAKGATGNVATEDVVYLLNSLGIQHGIDLDKLIAAGNQISQQLDRPTNASVARAINAKRSC